VKKTVRTPADPEALEAAIASALHNLRYTRVVDAWPDAERGKYLGNWEQIIPAEVVISALTAELDALRSTLKAERDRIEPAMRRINRLVGAARDVVEAAARTPVPTLLAALDDEAAGR
jgi:hypothetical protein